MTDESRSPAEQQLAKRLQQAAFSQARQQAPLSWPLAQRPTRRWLWPTVSLATAAAVGWMMFAGSTFWSVPQGLTSPSQPPMLMAENYQLEALDRRIQQAYLSGADEQTISQLWQQRDYWSAKTRVTQEWTQ